MPAMEVVQRSIWKVSTRFADVLGVRCERKRGPKDKSQMLALNIWKAPLAEMVKRKEYISKGEIVQVPELLAKLPDKD